MGRGSGYRSPPRRCLDAREAAPVHKEGPHQVWQCDACEKAQSERAAAYAAAQANGEFSICARLVDFFFRSGKKLRTVYEILEERAQMAES